ncbi:MAG TPA: SpoIIE family protein phosphatase [Streptosporangiaceae bacterium]|jgi:serine phosphatase RsbU (regulator of sigma subunit)/anti-sigma regulatory factor (Ser/Thr protein kinase)
MKSDTADMGATLVSGAAEPGAATVTEGAEPGAASVPSPATRTLILGIDLAGRIMQCDRHAPKVLGRSLGELLGAELADLTSGTEEQKDALAGLINAMRSGRESTTMLSLETEKGRMADAVVTVQPMTATDPDLTALAVIRLPVPSDERFLDPAVMRRALLDDSFTRIGATLDVDQMARELVDVIVPHFCNEAAVAVMESLIGADEMPEGALDSSQLLRRLAVGSDDNDAAWEATFPIGEVLHYPPGSPHARCLDSGEPVLVPILSAEEAVKVADAWQRKPVADLLAGTSLLMLPLIARDTNLGLFACTRMPGYRRFDRYDAEIGMEFAARAALFIDNARRYSRERATALTLQRSLLPTGLSSPSSVEVRHRYLPGSKLIEVGGDWYEAIALPGARVALVIGDVAGHGVHAAVTMGRLRAAIHTLAGLELPPADALQQLDALMQTLGEREPHFATCVYAIFDAVSGTCEMASAGHLSPLLVRPDGSSQFLDVPPAPPLGIGGGPIESKQFEIDDGSLFVLYTDGLVENRTRDIDDGLNRLRGVFGPGSAARPLEDLCKATLDGVYADQQRDDIAVLMARLRRIPSENHAAWTLPAKPTSVRRARALVGIQMNKWGLQEPAYTAELLVSELVTNALAYATGDVSIRLILDHVLVCEVFDDAAAMPRLRIADDSDENGRGLRVVSQLARRWGTRRTPDGKAVWFELTLPEDRAATGTVGPGQDMPAG